MPVAIADARVAVAIAAVGVAGTDVEIAVDVATARDVTTVVGVETVVVAGRDVGVCRCGLSVATAVPPDGAFVPTGDGVADTTAVGRTGGAMRASTALTSAPAGLSLVPTSVTFRDGA